MQLGLLVMTRAIAVATDEAPEFTQEVLNALERYRHKDWGDISDNDKQTNVDALEQGERIFAAYETSKGKIYIITEWDRSATTVLFAHQY